GVPCWTGEGLINNHVVKFEPREPRLLKRFAEYAHASQFVTDYIRSFAIGAIAASAGPALRTVSIPLPPADEQWSIAQYLDRETARIDALAEERRRLLSRLNER